MNAKHYHNLTWISMFLVGLIALMVGGAYFTISDPWLLDKKANEMLLSVSFKNLFAQNVNIKLQDYLTLLYRFFGWWSISVGMLISIYVLVTKMGTPLARNGLYIITVIIVAGLYYIEFIFIPTTPFIWLTHFITFLLALSIYGSINLKKYYKQ